MTPHFITEEEFAAMKKRVGGGVVGTAKPSNGVRRRDECNRALISAAGSNPAPSPLGRYRSKGEMQYAYKLDRDKAAGLIKAWWYEPFSLWLPGKVRYKPDFLIENRLPVDDNDKRTLELIEVKGWSRNRRDGITRLKIAAALFPCFVWRLVWMKKGGGFDGEYI